MHFNKKIIKWKKTPAFNLIKNDETLSIPITTTNVILKGFYLKLQNKRR